MDVGKAYSVLHRVVEKGFDIAGVSVMGMPFIVKTLTPLEMDIVKYHSFGKAKEHLRLYRLAYATYMVNGVSYLQDRPHSIEKLIQVYMSLPTDMVDKVEEISLKLQLRYRRYFRLAEGYILTRQSRALWKLRSGDTRMVDEITGIPGSTYVGVPECVDAWIMMNLALDYQEAREADMDAAMYVASATNPKGVQKTQQGMENRQKMIQEERDILAKYGSLAHRDFIEGIQLKSKDIWAASLATGKDLVNELHRQMMGEKDRHDLFMEKSLSDLRQKMEDAKSKADEDLKKARALRAEGPQFSGSFALTDEDMRRLKKGDVSVHDLAMGKYSKEPTESPSGVVSSVGKKVLRPSNGRGR